MHKKHFLLLKKLKNTESAQLCINQTLNPPTPPPPPPGISPRGGKNLNCLRVDLGVGVGEDQDHDEGDKGDAHNQQLLPSQCAHA